MRTLGKGYAGAKKFCTIMNMPPPPTEKAFLSNSRVIGRHMKAIAKEIMKWRERVTEHGKREATRHAMVV